ELAYALALIAAGDRHSVTPPWVAINYPNVERAIRLLRNSPCAGGCAYCESALDARAELKRIFGYDSFREYDGAPLQESAAKAAVRGKSLLAVFPTGGGKSVTFQLPALMAGEAARALTVVISPLQSLMKDQVDNLERLGIADAVAISGLQNQIERSEAIGRVASGLASILYISPEQLRSRTIEHLLLSRHVARFVIDEAHCFSAWGQDFRVDYLYIGDFIRELREKKGGKDAIPVSCFTATAKQKVISDIRDYFRKKLGLELELYATGAARKNLRYAVLHMETEDAKYRTLRALLQQKACPAIVYAARTQKTLELAKKLTLDGISARPFNGKMDPKDKIANQDAFMQNEAMVIVATSAFGMGVDKKDVGLVVHYDISDSLENYVQEAGRAGREPSVQAECYVLYSDIDLDKHFVLLNQTKLSISEIQQVWKAIKDFTRQRPSVCRSPLEIARQAGWNHPGGDVETRVRAAVAALESAGYVKRGKNSPHIYATSILAKNMQEAGAILDASGLFDEAQRKNARRLMSSLISSRSVAKAGNDNAESRVDYLADILGIEKRDVLNCITLMREARLLGDSQDMTAYMRRAASKGRPGAAAAGRVAAATAGGAVTTGGDAHAGRAAGGAAAASGATATGGAVAVAATASRAATAAAGGDAHGQQAIGRALERFLRLEAFLLSQLAEDGRAYNLKELNELAAGSGAASSGAAGSGAASPSVKNIRTILYYWVIKGYIQKPMSYSDKRTDIVPAMELKKLREKYERRVDVCRFIAGELQRKCAELPDSAGEAGKEVPVPFSLLGLYRAYCAVPKLNIFGAAPAPEDIEDALLYLSKIGAVSLEGGFLVLYSGMEIERLASGGARYKQEDYRALSEFYRQRIQQIHIVGEYANLMVRDYGAALRFVRDYFGMDFKKFIALYFKGDRAMEIDRGITPAQYRRLFGELSDVQAKIVNDSASKCIVAVAGPGSGKTRALVHKLASLLLLEDVKHEQLLMLTFSRAAATEFKKRLAGLIGNAASFVEIKTFHSYCFDLLGKTGSIEEAGRIVQDAAEMIDSGDVEMGLVTKSVLVIDEAQDMDEHEFALLRALMRRNDGMRVVAVGDDDQNIYGFRGSDSKYLRALLAESHAVKYEMSVNYRSARNIVALADAFAATIPNRMKSAPAQAFREDPGIARLVRHAGRNFEEPIANQILAACNGICDGNGRDGGICDGKGGGGGMCDGDAAGDGIGDGSKGGLAGAGAGAASGDGNGDGKGSDSGMCDGKGGGAGGYAGGGNACVLAGTNEEAQRVLGLLLRKGLRARLIQSNDGFRLCNLAEARFFLKAVGDDPDSPAIPDAAWDAAKARLASAYRGSACLDICMNMLSDFEAVSRTKYRTDLEEFIKESNYEDFYRDGAGNILVSTFHKAKGREFDRVYMMLGNMPLISDEDRRKIYVGLTRARNELHVHYGGNWIGSRTAAGACSGTSAYASAESGSRAGISAESGGGCGASAGNGGRAGASASAYASAGSTLDSLAPPSVERVEDPLRYPAPEEIVLQLSHRDVFLDFFKGKKKTILQLRSGMELRLDGEYMSAELRGSAVRVLKCSKSCLGRLEELMAKGYRPRRAAIRFIVAWKAEGEEAECAVILPDLYLRRDTRVRLGIPTANCGRTEETSITDSRLW
ncbi:MAG: RecQ family ATP-dependent DNA helicase, partial [Clostridiales bacterium]|nr:RecQ family ATP-dependent DNA helicase [Clostridiales bacterium]